MNPNPMVGSVVVHKDEIISEGFHEHFGGFHAERNALLPLLGDKRLPESTLYITLEPCSHFGKTPPCADLIVESKIKRVVIAIEDPNPLVSGKGIQRLRNAGIEVVVGIGETQARELNPFFLKYQISKEPYFIAKWAETKNGFFATNPKIRKSISGPDTKAYTHLLRKQMMAVLVGVGTWEIDKPQLDDRYHGGPNPIRLVWDPELKGTYNSENNSNLETWILNEKKEETLRPGYYFKKVSSLFDLKPFLYNCQINSVLVEGGIHTLEAFFKAGLIDEIHRFSSEVEVWENGVKSPTIPEIFQLNKRDTFETDILEIWKR